MNQDIFVCGDLHGKWGSFLEKIYDLPENSHIIQLGDIGLGFPGYDLERLEKIFVPVLSKKNQKLYLIRGNHDSPNIWNSIPKSKNIILVKDFTELTINGLNFYFIGGAYSIDRRSRTEGRNYWKNESINFDNYIAPKNKVDVLITHSAPDFCNPLGFNDLCRYYFEDDKELESQITDERKILGKIYDEIKPSKHYYGHFHSSSVSMIGNCTHNLLNELEIKEIINFKKL